MNQWSLSSDAFASKLLKWFETRPLSRLPHGSLGLRAMDRRRVSCRGIDKEAKQKKNPNHMEDFRIEKAVASKKTNYLTGISNDKMSTHIWNRSMIPY